MREDRLYRVVLSPHVTEKSTERADKNRQVTFKVARDASKLEIKYAIEKLFKVAIASVKTLNVNGKVKRFRQIAGKQSNWKKAIVTLKEGHDINVSEFE